MTQPEITLAGERVTRVVLHVPPIGPWWADVDLEAAPELSGAVTLALGALELHGTIAAAQDGTFALRRRTRVVAGGGGWSKLLPAKAYHNDLLVRARTVAEDAAREAGEQLSLDDFAPGLERIGADYVRQSGPAARVLEDVIGGVPWWVDYDGVTHVGARASSTPAADAYQLLDYDPRERVATIALDDLGALTIGAVLSEGLDAPQTVREIELEIGERIRARAWCGGVAGERGRVPELMRRIVERATDRRLFGKWRYRVVRMAIEGTREIGEPDNTMRVELQAVQRSIGLPDIRPISIRPGVSGVHSSLALGAEVLVEFVEGDRTRPIVTAFPGRDLPGYTPVETHITADVLRLGSDDADDGVALSSATDARNDAVRDALDAFVAAAPGSNDGGLALQTAVKAVWPGTTPDSDVGSSKVFAE